MEREREVADRELRGKRAESVALILLTVGGERGDRFVDEYCSLYDS